jgi:hypothetical protein
MNAPTGFCRQLLGRENVKPPTGLPSKLLWGTQIFVLPALIVFFLCPCGTLYKPKAPHGVRELSAVADAAGTVVVTPVVLASLPVFAAVDGLSSELSSLKHASAKVDDSSKKDDPGMAEQKKAQRPVGTPVSTHRK